MDPLSLGFYEFRGLGVRGILLKSGSHAGVQQGALYAADVAKGLEEMAPGKVSPVEQRRLKAAKKQEAQQKAAAKVKAKPSKTTPDFHIKKHSRGGKVVFAINQKGAGTNGRDKQVVQCQDYDICSIVMSSLNNGKINIEEAVKQINAWKTDKTLPP